MYRTIFVIKSENGFLQDVEKYTCIIDEAVQFTTFDSAVDKLKTVRHRLNSKCWVAEETASFPRKNSHFTTSF